MLYYIQMAVGAALIYNFALARFLGICPFLGVSKRLDTALGMSGAVIFVMTIAGFVTSLINIFLLRQTELFGYQVNLVFLQLLIFILVIASLVQLLEIVMQKVLPALYRSLGIYLPLITTNCAVLGAAQLNVMAGRGVWDSTFFSFFSGVGYAIALLIFSGLRERLDLAPVPRHFKGTAIAMVTAGILAMAFCGFSGVC